MNKVKNVRMFTLYTSILLRGVGTRTLNESAPLEEETKESEVFILMVALSK